MSQNDKSLSKELPWKEILAFLGTVLVAYLGYRGILSQIEIPIQATQTAQAKALSTLTPPVTTSPSKNEPTFTATSFVSKTPSTSLPTESSLSTFTPIPPPAGLGVLTIKGMEGCNISFTIVLDQQFLTNVVGGERKLIAAGTYNIQPQSEIRGTSIQKTVTIQEGEDKVVDFSNDMGLLTITKYPNFDLPLAYLVYQNNNVVGTFLSSDIQYCTSPGIYKISFSPSFIDLSFEIEVRAKESTIVNPEDFPQQIGVLSFSSTKNETPTFRVFDQKTGEQTGYGGYKTNSMWVKVGIYKIVISDPYIGLTYEDIEIKSGKETTITLP